MNTILIEARNENTPPKRLTEIFKDYQEVDIRNFIRNFKVKKALTGNPNTPLEILLKLGEHYPSQFIKNPALDLYLLSNPNLLAEMPESTLISITILPQAPLEFIAFALNNRKTPSILAAIISNHPQDERDLRNANLSRANLSGAYLKGANLRNAELEFVDLRSANLSGANLSGANLKGANLSGANLINADLRNADLRSIDITDLGYERMPFCGTCILPDLRDAVDLSRADLRNADLSGANLKGANLKGANLEGANLNDTNLWDANLWDANLNDTDLTDMD